MNPVKAMRTSSLLLLVALPLVSGCILAGGGSSAAVQDLEAARSRWRAQDLENYDMRMRRMCFCVGAGEWDVMVRGDSVVFAAPVEDQGWRLDPSWWSEILPTVDGLLDMVARAERDADQVTVSYDEDGWPTAVDIDWIAQAVDDEMSFAVTSIVEAPAAEVVDLPFGSNARLMGLDVRFDGIEADSRCAADVQCIWAGEARAQLTVTPTGGTPASVVLSDHPAAEGATNRVVIAGVAFRLLVVKPYPQRAGEAIPDASYVIRILAERA